MIGRELTKVFEEIAALGAGQALAWLDGKPERRRGEFVVAVERDPRASSESGGASAEATLDAATLRLLRQLLTELPPSRAARLAHEIAGAPREALYAAALALKDEPGDASAAAGDAG